MQLSCANQMVAACSNKILWPKNFGHFPIEITIENFKWPVMDCLWVYNAEKYFVGSTHLVAPYIQKRGRHSKKVVLRNTLIHTSEAVQFAKDSNNLRKTSQTTLRSPDKCTGAKMAAGVEQLLVRFPTKGLFQHAKSDVMLMSTEKGQVANDHSP